MKKTDILIEKVQAYIRQGIFPAAEFVLLDESRGAEAQHFLLGNVEPGMYWDLASVSKVLGTGTLMIDLVQAGVFELDEPLQGYLPDFGNNEVSIRQLLTHTSGLNPYIERRAELSADELRAAMLHLEVLADKTFRYTDVNFILLGFLLEQYFQKSLDVIFAEKFAEFGMKETLFGPVKNAVATVENQPAGLVHDPKAKVLGVHCGSAGLFSTAEDLVRFCRGYFAKASYLELLQNYSGQEKMRSLAWDLLPDDWLLHTGYTGTFLLLNLRQKQAVIFLSNRTYHKDERAQWILDRDILIQDFIQTSSSW